MGRKRGENEGEEKCKIKVEEKGRSKGVGRWKRVLESPKSPYNNTNI